MDKQSTTQKNADEIELALILKIIWNKKKNLFFSSLVVSSLAALISLTLPNIYTSKSILAPAQTNESLSNIASRFSGMASIAGFSIPKTEVDKVAMGIEVIKSYDFYVDLIKDNNLFFKLQAVKGWDQETNSLVVNNKIFDQDKNLWISEDEFSVNGVPSIQESHIAFLENLDISVNNSNGLVTISYEHYSPYVAQEVVVHIINRINTISMQEDIKIAQKTIDYLQIEVEKTQLNDVRLAINNLIEKQIETISLAQASPEYLLKTLSSPIAPELKTSPKRSVIVILVGLFTGFVGTMFFIFQHMRSIRNE
tara:strand:+ start:61 stop:990 length:930 start_codon:yes stop_codon:yes gene_type:complete